MSNFGGNYSGVKEYILGLLERELPKNLHYHNVGHTIDVIDAADRLISADDKESKGSLREPRERVRILLLTGALFHDAGFLRQYNNNEEIGAEIARKTLPRFGYGPVEVEHIAGFVLDTKLPHKPKSELGGFLCDADLDNLGREDFYVRGELLRRELAEQGIVYSPKQWYENSLKFLKSHNYWTKQARELRSERKRKHIREIKEILGVKNE